MMFVNLKDNFPSQANHSLSQDSKKKKKNSVKKDFKSLSVLTAAVMLKESYSVLLAANIQNQLDTFCGYTCW